MSDKKQIKPSIKSVEGIVHLGTVGTVLGLVWIAITSLNSPVVPDLPIDELLKQATSAQEIVAIYKAQAMQAGGWNMQSMFHGGFNMGSIMGLLTFLYKINTAFIEKRTELKKKLLEV